MTEYKWTPGLGEYSGEYANPLPFPMGDGPPTATSIEQSFYEKSHLPLVALALQHPAPINLRPGTIALAQVYRDHDHLAQCTVEGRKP